MTSVIFGGSRLGSRGSVRVSDGESPSDVIVQVERSTVHASDEAPGKCLRVPRHTTVREAVALAMADRYLPTISGGKATWIIESTHAGASHGAARRPIAVCAQQWDNVAFLIAADVSITAHFGDALPRLSFRYLCQDDPHAAVATARV